MRARQGIRQDVVGAREELRSQTDGQRLRPVQDRLSQGVEQRRPAAPLISEISHSCGVVAEDSYCATT